MMIQLSFLVAALFLVKIFSAATISSELASKLFFFETFDDKHPFETPGRWVKSLKSKYSNDFINISSPKYAASGFEDDKGLVLTEANKHYGVGIAFPKVVETNGQDFVIQYEMKLDDTLTCGGAYLKLFRAAPGDKTLNLEELSDETPYTIMFGPDKCGGNNKIHFILQHQSPVTKTWEEKHFNETIVVRADKKTHLYTLHIINSNNSFTIYHDKSESKRGSLFTHLRPPINPPNEVDDPNDVKPSDWVDDEKIPDPEATKPDDWDEDAPKTIPNPDSKKPEGWLDDEPLKIPDPEAKKPEDWDDEQDGLWEPEQVPNPKCENVGCGEWKAPNIKNPAYKGKWKAPLIPNPAYVGKWEPKKIPNKDYFFDEHPANIAPIAGVGIEVWTTNSGIVFDNIVVAQSLTAAFEFADATYVPKHDAEKAADQKKNKKDKKSKKQLKNKEEVTRYDEIKEEILDYLDDAVTYVKGNPLPIICTILAVILAILLLLPNRNKRAAVQATE